MRIDADAHIDETDATWEFMSAAEQPLKPLTMDAPDGEAITPGDVRPHRYWVVDGRLKLRRWRDEKRTGTTQDIREMRDIAGRMKHMNELGIDVQILYPTLLLSAVAARPEVDVAMCRSYNRWLCQATEPAKDRLRWMAILPVTDMAATVEQIRWAKDHGAVGLMKRALECDKMAADPYFFPIYEEAERLDLPVCIHAGSGNPTSSALSPFDQDGPFNRPHLSAFTSLVVHGIPDRFPKLRIGFIEVMASWIPYMVADLTAKNRFRTFHPFNFKDDLFRNNRFYVAVQTSEDLPYILKYGTEDNLVVGTDYSHDDQSAVLGVFQHFEAMADRGEISHAVASKMFEANPRTLYGI
jgi:uncharacterized protein